TVDVEDMLDVGEVASMACDCEVVFVSQLSEARVLSILQTDYGVDIEGASSPQDAFLAGALCVATNGRFRWIFVRDEDSTERKRFTIAHELGHLFLEAMPELERSATTIHLPAPLVGALTELRIFSRCHDTELIGEGAVQNNASAALSPTDLREIR